MMVNLDHMFTRYFERFLLLTNPMLGPLCAAAGGTALIPGLNVQISC